MVSSKMLVLLASLAALGMAGCCKKECKRDRHEEREERMEKHHGKHKKHHGKHKKHHHHHEEK